MSEVVRMTNSSTGGPVFVYVQDGKIVRMTPMDLDETDAASWKIEARGQDLHASAQDHRLAVHRRLQVHDLLGQEKPLPDEARGLRPQRGAEHPEPWEIGLRADQLG